VRGKAWIYAALVATTIVWGGSFVAVKHALQFLSPLQLLVSRFVPAGIAFALLLWWRERTALARVLREDWQSLCLMGLFGVIVYHGALNVGEQLIPAGTASLLMALNPAFTFILSAWLLGERVTWTRALGLSLAFVGLFIVVRFARGDRIDLGYLRGVLITLLAPVSWAAYSVISRPLASRHPPLAVTGLATILGTLPIAATIRPALLQQVRAMPADGWASVAFLAFFATLGGGTTWVAALEHLEASRVGVFIYLVPLWAAVLSQVLLGEPITLPLVVGASVIIGGVMLVNR